VTAQRVRPADGAVIAEVHVPASKSITNRAMICAGLVDGESEIVGVAPGDDTAAMVDCLQTLGRRCDVVRRGGVDVAVIVGSANLPPGPLTLHARLAGTTSRFVTALAALGEGPYTIDGDAPLRARPMGPLHDALVALGATVEPLERPGHLPVSVRRPLRHADAVVIPGDVSSQFVSALMLVGPYLAGGLRLGLSTALVSRPYVELTASVMRAFGADDVEVTDRRIHVGAGGYAPTSFVVEPDASSASYPLAAAAMVGGAVSVPGLGSASLQGDVRFVEILEAMGCVTSVGASNTAVLRRRDRPLRGIDIDMAEISDLVPTVAVVATQAVTPTRISGVGFIRGKESDRLGDLASELAKTGAAVDVTDDGLRITPVDSLQPARLGTHHDHRLAMAFGILGLVVPGIEVEDPEVVTKSWPGYWEMLAALPPHAP
jgi:3-phosphoshikimate 1-carboxyvinyltransferase